MPRVFALMNLYRDIILIAMPIEASHISICESFLINELQDYHLYRKFENRPDDAAILARYYAATQYQIYRRQCFSWPAFSILAFSVSAAKR